MKARTTSALRFGVTLGAVGAVAAAFAMSTPSARAAEVTRTRAVAPFDRVELDGAFTATIVAGTKATLAMTGSAADLERVTVDVSGGRLRVGIRPGSTDVRSIALSIGTANLRSFENAGAGVAHLSGVRGAFALENSGTATIDVAGRATYLTMTNDGVGTIDGTNLDARDATVTDDGVGSIDVRASGSLVMTVNGIGRIRYAGDPAHVERNVNGLGQIVRL